MLKGMLLSLQKSVRLVRVMNPPVAGTDKESLPSPWTEGELNSEAYVGTSCVMSHAEEIRLQIQSLVST